MPMWSHNDANTSWLRLTATSNCFLHPYCWSFLRTGDWAVLTTSFWIESIFWELVTWTTSWGFGRTGCPAWGVRTTDCLAGGFRTTDSPAGCANTSGCPAWGIGSTGCPAGGVRTTAGCLAWGSRLTAGYPAGGASARTADRYKYGWGWKEWYS